MTEVLPLLVLLAGAVCSLWVLHGHEQRQLQRTRAACAVCRSPLGSVLLIDAEWRCPQHAARYERIRALERAVPDWKVGDVENGYVLCQDMVWRVAHKNTPLVAAQLWTTTGAADVTVVLGTTSTPAAGGCGLLPTHDRTC